MKNYNDDEIILKIANHILENKSTIRATSQVFRIPKSTIHNYLNSRLKYINYSIYLEVKKLLKENFEIKHIHGGESTKLKYQKLKSEIKINDEIDLACF